MGKRNKVTTRDIAEYTGVSQSTVSMILSNKPHVSFSKETIDKVRQGAKELGYKKPVAGVKKKEQALAKSIIVICPLLSNGYYSMIIHSITERAKDYGYTVFTVSTLRDVSQEELYLNLLSGFELAGVISLYPPTKIAQANALSKQVPVVSIGDKPDACRFDAVELDSKKPGYIIAEHVLDQAEIHRIAIVPFIRKMGIGTLLFQEFERRYQELGVETIYLEVRESNEAAYQFYLKNGFEEYGRRAKYYKDPIEDAVLMFCDASVNNQSLPLDSSDTTSYNEEHKEENEMKCNVCGQLLKDKSDYIEIKKEWGYFSDKDTQIHEFRICEKCYDRIVKQFEIPPRVTEKNEILS